jgi:K+-transporting ATPase A subunit
MRNIQDKHGYIEAQFGATTVVSNSVANVSVFVMEIQPAFFFGIELHDASESYELANASVLVIMVSCCQLNSHQENECDTRANVSTHDATHQQ